jgi:hypothetical protein
MLAFAAKRAMKDFFAGGAFFFGHVNYAFSEILPNDIQIKTVLCARQSTSVRANN